MEAISEISPLFGGFGGCGNPYEQEEMEDA
jgi:hypothetical protein